MSRPVSDRCACLVLFLSCSVAMLGGCSGRSDGDDDKRTPATAGPAASQAADGQKALTLTPAEMTEARAQVRAVQPQQMTVPVAVTGTIVPDPERYAKVLPRLPGRIVASPMALGSTVKVGQTLALIESIELGEARSALAQARSEAAVTEAALARAEKLSAEDIVPRKDFLRAKADAERARATQQAAVDKLRMLGVSTAADGAGVQATYALVAPLSGTLIEKQAVPGTLVDKDALFTLADLSSVRLAADVFERDLARLAVGAVADVTVEAYPGERFPGRLIYLSDTLDAATRTVKAHIEIANPRRRLKPGMFASAAVASTATEQVLAVPAAAVTLIDGQPTVFVNQGDTFTPRPVQPGPELGGQVTIRQGLRAGERVVTEGAYALKARMLKSRLASED